MEDKDREDKTMIIVAVVLWILTCIPINIYSEAPISWMFYSAIFIFILIVAIKKLQ